MTERFAGGGGRASGGRSSDRRDEEDEQDTDAETASAPDHPTPEEVEETAEETRDEMDLSPDSDPEPLPVDEDDATGRDDEVGEAARELDREVRQEHTLAPEAVAVRYDEDEQQLRAELTDEGVTTLQSRRRSDVRREVASEHDEYGPEDFTVREEGDGFRVELTDDAREETARDRLADDHEDAREIAQDAPDHPTPEEVETVADVGALADYDFDDLRFEATDEGVRIGVEEDAQREALRERVAARDDRLDPEDIVVEETNGGLTARAEEDALADALRHELADEHDGVDPEDVDVTFEDGEAQARAEVQEGNRIQDLLNLDVEVDRTALFDLERSPVSVEAETNIDLPSLDDLDERPTPPTAIEDYEAQVIDRVTGGVPSDIREVEEQYLGERGTREEDLAERLMGDTEQRLEVDEGFDPEDYSNISAKELAAAGAVGVAVPEPTSSLAGGAAVLAAGGILAGGMAVDAARRNELDVTDGEVQEVGVGATVPQQELDVSEDVGRTTQVELAEQVAELDVGEQDLAEIDVPADEFVAGTSPALIGQQEAGRESITREDSRTDIQRLIDEGDDVFEGRRDPRGAFRDERAFPTGAGAVVGREIERMEEAETVDIADEVGERQLEELDVAQQGLNVDVSPLSAPLDDIDPLADTALDLDVGLDSAGQQVQALEQQAALQQQQSLLDTAGAPGFADPTANIPDFAEGTGVGFGTATGAAGPVELPPMMDLPDPTPPDRRRDPWDLTGVEVEFDVISVPEVETAVDTGLDDIADIGEEDFGL